MAGRTVSRQRILRASRVLSNKIKGLKNEKRIKSELKLPREHLEQGARDGDEQPHGAKPRVVSRVFGVVRDDDREAARCEEVGAGGHAQREEPAVLVVRVGPTQDVLVVEQLAPGDDGHGRERARRERGRPDPQLELEEGHLGGARDRVEDLLQVVAFLRPVGGRCAAQLR